MKYLVLSLFLCVMVPQLFSQFSLPTKKDAIECRNRTLLVELKSEDEKYVKKLKKKGKTDELKQYHDYIAYYNSTIRNVIEKYWKVNKKIEYGTSEEIDSQIKKDKKAYVVFSSGWTGELSAMMGKTYISEYYTFTLFFSEKASKRYDYEFDKAGSNTVTRGGYIFKVPMLSNRLSEADYKFIIDQFNFHISYAKKSGDEKNILRAFKFPKNSKSVYLDAKKDTLLIPIEILSEVLNEENISKIYKYEYKIVSFEENDSIINSSNPGFLYIQLSWSDKIKGLVFIVCENDTGRPVTEINAEGFDFAIYGTPSFDGYGVSPIYSWRKGISLRDTHLTALNGMIKNYGKYNIVKYMQDRKKDKKKLSN